tara:strand:+ start:437 stop:577 length:141 start_codon:yes stop_codon:yes gene_type:complete
MKEKINPDNDSFDPSEEYFKRKISLHETETETEEFFPLDTLKPPHY